MKPKNIGAITIQRVGEHMSMPLTATRLCGGMSSEIIAHGKKSLDRCFFGDGPDEIVLGFHSFVIQSKGRTILVDTCHGNDKQRQAPIDYAGGLKLDYLGNLAQAGLTTDDIDIVLCTHLHFDHVGWNTRLDNGRWVPTFPNAQYLMSKADYTHFEELSRAHPEDMHAACFDDSILPVVTAGQALLVESNHVIERELAEGLWLEGAPGHTPGSILLHANTPDGHALFSGDVFHHPIQIIDPSLSSYADEDPAMAAKTRRRIVETYADTDTLLCTAHFPDPTVGRITSHGDEFRFQFAE